MTFCCICKKKLSKLMLSIYTCKCQNLYCPKHIIDHHCTFDYKTAFQKQIICELPIILTEKIVKL